MLPDQDQEKSQADGQRVHKAGMAHKDEDDNSDGPGTGTDTAPFAVCGAFGQLTGMREEINARRRSRHLRRSLKESGDFLGVQGINPQTSELDVLTPSSSSHTGSSSRGLRRMTHAINHVHPKGGESSRSASKYAYVQEEQEKKKRDESRKDSIRALQREVRWLKGNNEWSSAAEPDLSPIPSQRSGGSLGSLLLPNAKSRIEANRANGF